MKHLKILLTFLLIGTSVLFAQQRQESYISRVNGLPGKEVFPYLVLKTNLLYDLTSTINLGAEVRLSNYLTLELSANFNPWTFSKNKKLKHILVQPELRYWIDEPFNGHFFGAHLLYSNFNFGNLKFPMDILPGLEKSNYRGDAYGMGFSYGYQWILSPRWSMEASFGFGYMYMDYKRYERETCGQKLGEGNKHYFGPTKASISFIYIIK